MTVLLNDFIFLSTSGGRMSTSRCNKDSRSTVDLGAQYISATPDYAQKHARYFRLNYYIHVAYYKFISSKIHRFLRNEHLME